jgi:all-trans-retinol 13,14-reductase
MYCFIGLDSDQLDLPAWNIWRMPTDDDFDLDKMILKFQADPEHAPVPLFCGFPSVKDPTFKQRHPGKTTAVLLTIGTYEWFTKWQGTKWGKRGADYDDFKNMLKDRIVNEGLYEMWPQTKGHVEYTALGTSLTYNHFIGSMRGECYGLQLKPERFEMDDWLRPESPVPGLFLTGQDVAVFGIAGALMSGVLTSMSVLGYGSPLDIVSGRNIVEDLWHLDSAEDSQYSVSSAKHFAKAYSPA